MIGEKHELSVKFTARRKDSMKATLFKEVGYSLAKLIEDVN